MSVALDGCKNPSLRGSQAVCLLIQSEEGCSQSTSSESNRHRKADNVQVSKRRRIDNHI